MFIWIDQYRIFLNERVTWDKCASINFGTIPNCTKQIRIDRLFIEYYCLRRQTIGLKRHVNRIINGFRIFSKPFNDNNNINLQIIIINISFNLNINYYYKCIIKVLTLLAMNLIKIHFVSCIFLWERFGKKVLFSLEVSRKKWTVDWIAMKRII